MWRGGYKAFDSMGSLAYMDNDECINVSGGRYSRTIVISIFCRGRADEGILNNKTRDFLWLRGKKVFFFFVEIFLNETAKSSPKREDKI